MKRIMFFKQMFYDMQLMGDRTTISFFADTDENNDSVTSMTEEQAVNWLFQNSSFRQFFIEEFFDQPKNVRSFFGLKKPFTIENKKPGDIDLLLVDVERPDKSIAFECKRVKAVSLNKQISKVNNVEKVRDGVIQANKYQSLGFYQSYLMVILLDDGRHYKTPNTLFRSTESDQLKHLYDIPWNEPLNRDVGIIFVKVNQITGRHINNNGGIGLCIDKLAQPLEQTVAMTNKIKELINQG